MPGPGEQYYGHQSGPHAPYTPSGPQAPYPPAEHPGEYAAPPPMGPDGYGPQGPYGESPHPGPPPGGRRISGGTILLISLSAVVVVLIVAVVAIVLARPQPVTHETTPTCADLQSEVLEEAVSDPQVRQDDFSERSFWDEQFCEWQSADNTAGTRGFANVLVMRNENTSSASGDEIAVNDLNEEIADKDVTPVEGIGEEAYSWYDTEKQLGCVASRTDNVFVRTCYDAAQDFFDLESIPEEEAIGQAIELARDIVGRIAAHEY